MDIVKGWLKKRNDYIDWTEIPLDVQKIILGHCSNSRKTILSLRLVSVDMKRLADAYTFIRFSKSHIERLFKLYEKNAINQFRGPKHVRRLVLSQTVGLSGFFQYFSFLKENIQSQLLYALFRENPDYIQLILESSYLEPESYRYMFHQIFKHLNAISLCGYKIPAVYHSYLFKQLFNDVKSTQLRFLVGSGIPIDKYQPARQKISGILQKNPLKKDEWVYILKIGDQPTIETIMTIYSDRLPDRLPELLTWAELREDDPERKKRRRNV